MAFREREPVRRAPLRPVNRPLEVDIERTPTPERGGMVQRAAQVFGWVNVIIGVAGFFAPLMAGAGGGLFTAGPGLLFNVFGMNWVHALAHIILGAIGVVSAKTFVTAHRYFVAMAIVFGLLTIAGIAMARPGIFYMLGMAMNVADTWLHAGAAVIALILAFTDRNRRLVAR